MGGAEVDVRGQAGRGVRIVAVLVLAVVLPGLSGCTADGDDPPATATEPDAVVDVGPEVLDPGLSASGNGAAALAFAGCRQFHTAFSAQAEDLQPRMPRGFTVATDEAGLAQLAVIATSCSRGPYAAPVAMLWVQVAATPPPELADAGASSSVAIEAYLGDAALVAWALDTGLALAEACTCADEASTTPGVHVDAFTSDGAEDDYRLQTLLAPDSGSFDGGEAHLYVAVDGEAVARLRAVAAESNNRGLGSVALTYQGPGGAPPVFAGIAHVIDGLAFTWVVDQLEVA